MSGSQKHTNPALVLIAIVLCLVCGATLTRSSANPSPISEENTPDIVLVKNTNSDKSENRSSKEAVATVTPVLTEAPKNTPTPEITATPELEEETTYVPSEEASKGIWTANGSNWLFLIDGVPHYGWLYDNDEKIYYFNGSGIMVTGWQDIGSKRYYFNLDGVLQTGDITLEGKTYHLLEDGSLEGYSSKKKSKKSSTKKESAAKETEKSNSKKNNTSKKSNNSKKSSTSEKNNTSKKKENADASSEKEKVAASTKENTEPKYVALTFDDGPSSFTNRLLDCFEEHNIKATFFLVGYEISSFPEEVRRMEELGMEIGNHSADHKNLSKLDNDHIQQQISSVDAQIEELTGHTASVVRPPYGAVNDTVKSAISQSLILWSIDTLDWESKNAETIVDTVLSEIENGSVILMHDIYSTTVDAVEILVPELISQGYEFLTIHELAEKSGISLESGNTYSSFQPVA